MREVGTTWIIKKKQSQHRDGHPHEQGDAEFSVLGPIVKKLAAASEGLYLIYQLSWTVDLFAGRVQFIASSCRFDSQFLASSCRLDSRLHITRLRC